MAYRNLQCDAHKSTYYLPPKYPLPPIYLAYLLHYPRQLVHRYLGSGLRCRRRLVTSHGPRLDGLTSLHQTPDVPDRFRVLSASVRRPVASVVRDRRRPCGPDRPQPQPIHCQHFPANVYQGGRVSGIGR